jgi:hypothetical protein
LKKNSKFEGNPKRKTSIGPHTERLEIRMGNAWQYLAAHGSCLVRTSVEAEASIYPTGFRRRDFVRSSALES